ncbi:hypothetical protein rsdtw13_29620 [Clostridium sp. TW13]|uniref:Uncharacterized protein n=1 Tax=Inconstantimicrobium mannanitabidum TaxID=1604901 RepID=A0ACB5RFA1_9CLOT|nr:hypothetical protein rsdtw13_29620 [Clostridium sp. TW13]
MEIIINICIENNNGYNSLNNDVIKGMSIEGLKILYIKVQVMNK